MSLAMLHALPLLLLAPLDIPVPDGFDACVLRAEVCVLRESGTTCRHTAAPDLEDCADAFEVCADAFEEKYQQSCRGVFAWCLLKQFSLSPEDEAVCDEVMVTCPTT